LQFKNKKKDPNVFTQIKKPIREELFNLSQLEKFAEGRAHKHVLFSGRKSINLSAIVAENEKILVYSFEQIIEAVRLERAITPAAEWLIDNFYIIEEQIKDIREHLPPEFYKELPKLSGKEFFGLPRVYAIAWDYVAHTDSLFTPEKLKIMVKAYQRIQPLTMGELWALAITLRVVLVENLKRLAVSIVNGQKARLEADLIADELLGLSLESYRTPKEIIKYLNSIKLNIVFSVELIQRLRFQEGDVVSVLKWLEEKLTREGMIVDQIVQEEHQEQTKTNITVINIINSMRLMSAIDWRDFFEEVSLVDEIFRENPIYPLMDFFTRDNYRHSLEELARGTKFSEQEIAKALVNKTKTNSSNPKSSDLGYFLLTAGRYEFEKEIHFKLKFKNFFLRNYIAHREVFFLGSIISLTLLFSAMSLMANISLNNSLFSFLGFLGLFPAAELAITIVNRITVFLLPPRHLPRLDLSKGIPVEYKTYVVVPSMLINLDDIPKQVEQLEVHYLSNPDGAVYFSLLTDWRDSLTEHNLNDEILFNTALNSIENLNLKYGLMADGKKRFTLLHRFRKWNSSELKWMGWERKRGKLHEFNRLLRGATDTSFVSPQDKNFDLPENIKYVITLDADTKLPRGSVAQLVGTIAHPLNQPKFDTILNRVIEGYGILQPRITPMLSSKSESSFFQRLSSGPCGIDPYAFTVSDVYQDLFGEGSYTGKGIYNVDVFEQALTERTPENRLLSHDLYEGNFARCGLVSDVELFEEFPSNFEVAVARNHRWTRGDWQLFPWIMGRAGNSISVIGRWKMIDNLRRSILAPVLFALFIGLFYALAYIPSNTVFPLIILILTSLSFPHLLPFFEGLFSWRKKIPFWVQLDSVRNDLYLGLSRFLLNIIFIPYHAWVHVDAIFRTFIRLVFTKKKLLEWMTSAQSKNSASVDFLSFFKRMLWSQIFLLVMFIYLISHSFASWIYSTPFFILWFSAPFVAWKISLPIHKEEQLPLTENEILIYRNTARKTWRFFSNFVNSNENHLPPDNFQEIPVPVIAHRSSPTNFGLYLLSVISARDFGWIGIHEMVERLESTLTNMQNLPRYNGHFYNWYETTTKAALEPRYISSVDNGNLAGHLLAVAQSCEEMSQSLDNEEAIYNHFLKGIDDSLRLLTIAFLGESDFLVDSILVDLKRILSMPQSLDDKKAIDWDLLISRSSFLLNEISFYGGKIHADMNNEIHNWVNLIHAEINGHARDYFQFKANREITIKELRERLQKIQLLSRELFYDMDFSFLYDPTRKLFSIGYRMFDSTLDSSFYDLLASEARLLSFVAIAKGDVPVAHWFRLGRALTSINKGVALISWSGSMFEYLMPSLVMNTPTPSLLEQTNRMIVKKQINYAEKNSIPWGMSESAYNARDLHLTYQYSNFGVPDLAFKRGIGKDLVIAPYATVLAGMIDAQSAVKNLEELILIKADGPFGFYESIDFTKSRLPEKVNSVVVKAYMAHHQGMSLVAISNILHKGIMVERFHREPIIQSSELLLQERTPKNIAVAKTRPETIKISHVHDGGIGSARQYFSPHHRVPRTHLLSNGHYSVMLTTSGSGSSRMDDLSVTRWREDTTRDHWGSYIFLRDIHSQFSWSAGFQPTCIEAENYEVTYTEDRAHFERIDKLIKTHLEIIVSTEDNAEMRKLSLTNNASVVRVIEVTTYSEVVLNTQAADIAHPTFSNLFVQTEFYPEASSVIATRRPRSIKDIPVWMSHIMCADNNAIGDIEYETDRLKFIGRGRTIRNPIILENKKLSNTVGSVLDPVVSLRTRIRIEPGATATIIFSTVIGNSREDILNLSEKYFDPSTFERASNLAWTQAQVKLHYLGIDQGEASLFQQLANRIIYLDSSLRATSEQLKENKKNVTSLWAHGISGDFPIVLVRISELDQRSFVRQVLLAHEYWLSKRLIVDIIILNEKINSYSQELQDSLVAMVAARKLISGNYVPKSLGKIFLLRADILPPGDVELIIASARAILIGRLGSLSDQVKRTLRKVEKSFDRSGIKITHSNTSIVNSPIKITPVHFDNGLGGFSKNGLEYIIHLKNNLSTPAPWINVVANTHFGFHVSESGAGSTWSMNSRENQLTPWTNDPVSDPTGDCFYFYDVDLRELWSPTLNPIRIKNAEYLIKHGQGYSQFETKHLGIHSQLTQIVHKDLPVKISQIRLKNETNSIRHIEITSYVEWILSFSKSSSISTIVTDYDNQSKCLTTYNSWNQEFGSRIAFASFLKGNDSWTGSRLEFIGRNGNLERPNGLFNREKFSGKTGAGLDACSAIKKLVTIQPNSECIIEFVLGQTEESQKVKTILEEITNQKFDKIYQDVLLNWKEILEKIHVETPDLSMNIMLNRWLLYQTIVCRLWSRTAFYQAGGAFGFRDQLQDSMAVIWTNPQMIKDQILRAASRQFIEGDVQHWWHMPSGRGVRTHFSDDLLWLPYVVSYYLQFTNDLSILDESISYLTGPKLSPDQEDDYFTPENSHETSSLFEHCARALDRSLAVGVHGLPLIGGGDWNDGMNRIGQDGKGESVWLGWFLISNLREFSKLAELRHDHQRALSWRSHSEKLKLSIEENGWDGNWYRRAFYDDGVPLGSAGNSECQIDSIAQSWGIISKAADPKRAELAMKSVEQYLVKENSKMILLLTPPFDKDIHDPGYIKGYIPGVRENGGQYSHAAIWCILAYVGLNDGKRAVELFNMINPINHALSPKDMEIYKVEPYVIAADVYSASPHEGRGGWTWYTGSSGWMYTTGLVSILGFKILGDKLLIEPNIHPEWDNYKITYKHKRSTYIIEVKNPFHLSNGKSRLSVDGRIFEDNQDWIELIDDQLVHYIGVELLVK
jgi:cyclic beta-1,2-glucan synthetase